MQQPEAREEEKRPEGAVMCFCPACGHEHWMPMHPMRMKRMMRMGMWPMGTMPMGMWFLGAMPLLLGFIAGFLAGSTRRA